MQQRKLGPFQVGPIGLGCMNLSHAYGGRLRPKWAKPCCCGRWTWA